MIKNITQNPTAAAILGAVVAVVLGLIILLPVVSSKVSNVRDEVAKLTDQVNDINNQVIAMSSYFKSKYPGVNFVELANTIAKKNLPTNAFYKTLSVIDIENDSTRSRAFLSNDLGFTPDEAKRVIPAITKVAAEASKK